MTPEEITRSLRYKDMPEDMCDNVFSDAEKFATATLNMMCEQLDKSNFQEKLYLSSLYFNSYLIILRNLIESMVDEYTQKEMLDHAIKYLKNEEDI